MSIEFSKNLIKGKIAEVVFEQMFREAKKFTIIPFGYENVIPELSQCDNFSNSMAKKVIDNIRNAPDFALISNNKKIVLLVEVKYRLTYDKNEIKEIAEKQKEKWDPSFLFIATSKKFYFDTCLRIVKKDGMASDLSPVCVSNETQNKYLELIRKFET